jgi:hypothetical protein
VSTLEQTDLRKHAAPRTKRLRRVVPAVAATAVTASLIAGITGPANAAEQPTRPTPIPAAALEAAAQYVHVVDGRVTVDTAGAAKAGVSSQILTTETSLVTNLNGLIARQAGAGATTVNSADGTTATFAAAAPAAMPDTVIQVLPGVTLTIDDSGIQLALSKQAVAEIESVVGFGQTIAALVAPILTVAGVPNGAAIAGIVGAALAVGNAFLKLCTAPDGSATFTVPWLGIPSCSGLSSIF